MLRSLFEIFKPSFGWTQFQLFNWFWLQPLWSNANFFILKVVHPLCIFLFHFWLFELCIHTEQVEFFSFNFLQTIVYTILILIIEIFCTQKTQFHWNIYETIGSSKHRTDNLHSNTPSEKEMMIKTTELKILLNLLKIKHL